MSLICRKQKFHSKERTVNVCAHPRPRTPASYELRRNIRASFVVLFSAALLTIGAMAANAATLCVNPGGTQGCYKTISAAMAAAAPNDTINVWAGTYSEYVVVSKPLHIIGADANTTILDAGGLPNGFNIDGLNNPGLVNVSIRNFTVKNANFEGIVATNTSFLNISNNTVMNNNRSLNNGQCPGLPAWETAESFDCGEGIHLNAVDHSVVVSNVSTGNAGGILLSDETGVLHDNLIARNNVHDNPYDCGITLASHPPYNHDSPYGIMHNTIYQNTSSHNGNQGSGAGVGIFSPIPGGTNSGNVVVGNLLTDNGQPGVAMHGHAPGQELSDNLIADNTLANNAQDTADAATPGPTGINLFSVSPNRGTIVALNNFDKEQVDIAAHHPGEIFATLNNLTAYGLNFGLLNFPGTFTNATSNWWGCPDGPNQGQCSYAVSFSLRSLLTNPWLSSQYTPTSAPKTK